MKKFIVEMLRRKVTWGLLFVVLSGYGIKINPAAQELITNVGTSAAESVETNQ